MKELRFRRKSIVPFITSTTAIVFAFLLIGTLCLSAVGFPGKVFAQSTLWQPTSAAPIHWQWQIGTDFNISTDLVPNVTVYDVDGFSTSQATVTALHALGYKVIAYFSFGTYEDWRPDATSFPSNVKGSTNGWPGENWLDIRADSVKTIMTARINLAAAKGFDAIEPDNIDGYSNSTGFPLTASNQLAYNEWIATAVHAAGLSVGLKNDIDQVSTLQPYFDWCLNEESYKYSEYSNLSDFVNANKAVFEVEYGSSTSQASTMNSLHINSMTRDLDLTSPSTGGYKRIPCIPDTQNSWTLTNGTSTKLAFSTQPGTSNTAGSVFGTAPVVSVQDAGGNTVTTANNSITLVITGGTGSSGAVLSGTATVNAVNGVATFNGLSINLAGTGYTLTASASGLTSTTSNAINVAAGALDHITVNPANPTVVVSGNQNYTAQGYDSANNVISGLSYTWSCTNATAGSINSSGVFTAGAAAGSYPNVIQAVSGGKTGTASVTVTARVATKLAFSTQPGTSNTAGSVFGTAPVVSVQDAGGNTVTTANNSITLVITGGTGSSGAVLSGTATVNAVNGVATFNGLSINLAGTGYTLTASASGLTSTTSNAINVAAGALDHITVSPANPTVVVSGNQSYTAQGYDSANNVISGLSYTWSCTNATAGSINSSGVFTAGAAAGSYPNVIQAVSGGKTGTASVTVTARVATKLAFSTQPGTSNTAGSVFGTAPVVSVQDAGGNTVTTANNSITLVITGGTGSSGAVLSGTATVNAVNGVATFNGLSINLAGTGYTLTASASGLTSTTSNAINVAAGALDHITVSPANPTVVVSGNQSYTAQGYDSANNVISGLSYTWSCTNATAGSINSSGVFTAGAAAGSYPNVMQAVSGGKTGIASVTVTARVATKLAFSTQPGTSNTAGVVFGTAPVVSVQDAGGNTVTTANNSITLVITGGTGTSGAVLSGTATVNAVNGVAAFNGLSINLAGTGYTLTASASGLTSTTSNAINVAAGALDHITVSPANSTVVVSGNQSYTAQGYDSANNVISGLSYTWSCTNATAGSINSSGVFTAGSAAGSYPNVMQAVSGGKTGTASVTVTARVATKLAFSTQPGTSNTAGVVFGTAPVVSVQDAGGNTVTTANNSITLVITGGTGTSGAVLSGTATVNAVNGVATFNGLSINLAGTGYTLTASTSGLTSTTSNTFDITTTTGGGGGTGTGSGGGSGSGGTGTGGGGGSGGGAGAIGGGSGSTGDGTTGGSAAGSVETGVTSLVGSIAADGTITANTETASSDGIIKLTIPAGTSFLTPDGLPSTFISMVPMSLEQQPPAPANAEIIGLVYNLGPTGSTFDPPASLTFTFKGVTLPNDVNGKGLTLAYWDDNGKQWVPLTTETIDMVNDTITAAVSHFSTYAILDYPPSPAEFVVSSLAVTPNSVKSGEQVNITAVVSNIGGTAGNYNVVLKVNGVVENEKAVTVDTGATATVEFELTENTANTYNLDVNGQSAAFSVTVPPAPVTTYTQTMVPQITAIALTPTPTPTPTPAVTPDAVPQFRLALLGMVIGIALVLILTATLVILMRRRSMLRKR